MILKTIEVIAAVVINNKIEVLLPSNLAPFPIIIFWDGVRYDMGNILGESASIINNILYLPAKMEGDKINIDFWSTDDEIATSSSVITAQNQTIEACKGVRFIFNNRIPESTLSSSGTLADELPLDNIKTEWRSRISRHTNSTENIIISGVVGSLRTFSGFALSGFNLTSAAKLVLRIYNKPEITVNTMPVMGDFRWGIGEWGIESEDLSFGLVYESENLQATNPLPIGEFVFGLDEWGENNGDGVNPTFALYFDQVLGNYFEIEIYDPLNTDGVIDLRQVFLGDAVILDKAFSYGLMFSWDNAQTFNRTEGGSLITIGSSETWRTASIPFEMMTIADTKRITSQQRANTGKPVFCSIFIENNDNDNDFNMPVKIVPPEFELIRSGVWAATLKIMEI